MKLLELIIDKYERSDKGKIGDFTGNVSLRIEEKHYKQVGKDNLILEAKELEEAHLLRIHWIKGYYKVDIEKVEYPLVHMEQFYQRLGRIPKYQLSADKLSMVRSYYEQFKSSWLRAYTEQEIIPKLLGGTDNQSYIELECLYQGLAGIDNLTFPVFKRVFSKRVLGNSKLFEKNLQDKIIRIARKYHGEIEDAMEDSEVLSQLYIEEYSQELSIKGSLRLIVENSNIDTGVFPYGTVLNTATLKNAIISENPQLQRILIFENKANFVSEPYQEGTVILFSHGFFTPVERYFLQKLQQKLSCQRVIYQHSGDLDYGGIRIFQSIKEHIFPELQPYHMDVATFEQYKEFGEPIESGPLAKLKKVKEPAVQKLIDCILDNSLIIEQEAFL